jgi:hypothetical protein
VNDFGVSFTAVNEDDEKQNQAPGHPDDLVTLLAFTPDEVIVRSHVMRVVEDFLRRLERNSMDPSVFCLGEVPCESRFRMTLLYIQSLARWAGLHETDAPAASLSD